jgi:hypothetical protein
LAATENPLASKNQRILGFASITDINIENETQLLVFLIIYGLLILMSVAHTKKF